MEALYLLVPLSICVVAVALWIFFGAADSGQFDDLAGPALRILRDDDRGGGAADHVVRANDPGA
jgi:cbb3-type cytochrome oxidase maturation protein